jgi:photosystem II stability/assembly factor-like uncharacterized protein
MRFNLNLKSALAGCWMLLAVSQLAAQQPTWKALRQQGANFYEIQDTFERQNAAFIQALRNAPPVSEGDSAGKFNPIIKYNRWAHRVKARASESQGDMSAMVAGNARALQQRAHETQSRTGESWQSISPSVTPTVGGNGRINAIRVHPTNENHLLACSPTGGLWKSVDGGASWTPISENIANLGCSDVAFSPTDPNILYLATGDGEASDSYSTGVYRSSDGGATWAPTGLTFTSGERIILSRLLVHPMDGSILVSSNRGIHRSTNGGTTWTLVSENSTRDMEFKPNTPAIVYATRYLPTGSCFLRSSDGGASWTTISTGLPTSNIVRAAIAVTPANPDYVYLMIANDSDQGLLGVYRSTNSGLNFTEQRSSSPNLMGWNYNGDDSGGQGWYDLAIAASPTNPDLIYTGGVNIWKSTNGGTSFNINTHWYGAGGAPTVHADIHDLMFQGSTLWAACDGGIFKTTDNGVTWTDKSANLSIAQMYGMGLSATDPELIISGHQDNGTNLRTSASEWGEVLGGDGMQCFIDRTNNDNMFASLYYGRIYRSNDKGNNFDALSAIPEGGWVTPWLQDPVSASTLYAGGKEVYKSTDLGDTWSVISSFGGSDNISAIEVARTNNQIIFAARGTYATSRRLYTPQLFKSVNGGTTWTMVTAEHFPTNASILGLHIDVNDANRIYIGFASYMGASVFRSDDGGATWTNISEGLPQTPANCFVTTLGSRSGEVFVGTDVGVYYRTDVSSVWESFNNQLPSIPVSDLEVFYPTAKLRIATYGRGVWETVLPGYNAPPTVRLTAPTNGQTFANPAQIALAATASDADGRVTRVDFYKNNVLIGSDTSAPYAFTWANATVGNYQLTAKAVDDSTATTISTPISISVLGAKDAEMAAIVSPPTTVTTDSVLPAIRLRNAGMNALTAATIYYQLDRQTVQSYSWTGNLTSLNSVLVPLPTVLRYNLGIHQFMAYVVQVADENPANDTLRLTFDYQTFGTCSNNYEPNDELPQATVIPTNTTIRSRIATSGDVDFFQFKTKGSQTAFQVDLNELPADHDLVVYRYDYANRNLIWLGASTSSNLNADSVVLNALTDTGTFYAKVSYSHHPTQCYALRVSTKEPIRYDLGIDTIYAPRGNVFSNRVTPVFRIKNDGNVPITNFEYWQELDGNSIGRANITLSPPLLPDSSRTVTAESSFTEYSTGTHIFKLDVAFINGWYSDSYDGNDTAKSTFRYILLPEVALISPSDGQIFADNSTISFSASATARNGGSISKVEFYANNTLLHTDLTSPYSYDWANVPLGTYHLMAKAYDDELQTTVTPIQTVYVSGAHDAGTYGILNSGDFTSMDSVRPQVQIRNYGSDTLKTVRVYYQLDNQTIENQWFTNLQLGSGSRTTLTLPMTRYAIGNHTYNVWTAQPNQVQDVNTGNDTFRLSFNYVGFGACADNYEPNDTYATATVLPTNTTIRSKIAVAPDEDVYQFKTQGSKTAFRVVLNELPINFDFTVYRYDPTVSSWMYLGSSQNWGTTTDSVAFMNIMDTGTYAVKVAGYSYPYHSNQCYALTVSTHEPQRHDLSIDSILTPSPLVLTSQFKPVFRVTNRGNVPIAYFAAIPILESGWTFLQGVTLSPPLMPDSSRTIVLNTPISGYSAGLQRFELQLVTPNGVFDANPQNDSLSIPFRYVLLPTVTLTAPLDEQIFAWNQPIALTASATARNGGSISKVEFYNGNTLLSTDETHPYSYSWTNVPLGSYAITAKAYDNESFATTSTVKRIYVTNANDAGVTAVLNADHFAGYDSTRPQVQIRNYGSDTLRTLMVYHQLDNQPIESQAFTSLNVATGVRFVLNLPMTRYSFGAHTYKVWTVQPNGITDLNVGNDTLQYAFEYRDLASCGDNFEPNNTITFATPIPTDKTVRGKIRIADDVDVYLFKTTEDRPYFTAVVDELQSDHELEIAKYEAWSGQFHHYGNSWSSGTNPDSVRYTNSADTGTFLAVVWHRGTDTNCYALRINTFDAPITDIGIDSILNPTANMTTNSFTPVVRVRNYGNQPVNNFELYSYWDNRWNAYQYISLPTALQPNETVIITLNAMTVYEQGMHPLTAYTRYPNGWTDARPRNDSMSMIFHYELPRWDANPFSIQRPTGLVTVDTALLTMVLQNKGLDTLTSVEIHHQLNNGTPQMKLWTGSLATGNHLPIELGKLNLGTVGLQSLKIWTNLPNNHLDENRQEDTLNHSFNYQLCGDNYEPNNAYTSAVPLTTNKAYYAQIAQSTDKDYYAFVTTAARPKVRLTLRSVTLDGELQLYKVENNGDLSFLALANRRGLGRELLVWNESSVGNGYVVAVTGFNQTFDADSCYSLLLETADTLMTGLYPTPATTFQFQLAPNPAQESVTVNIQSNSSEVVDYQLVVTDMLGRTVLQRKLGTTERNTPITIATDTWSKGMYFVSIRQNGQIRTEKLVIE